MSLAIRFKTHKEFPLELEENPPLIGLAQFPYSCAIISLPRNVT
jgi:hypothetical protein